MPGDATHLVLSVGGNDALREAGVLSAGARSVAEAVERLAEVRDRFRSTYEQVLDAAGRHWPADGRLHHLRHQLPGAAAALIVAALTLFNDVITRAAFARGVAVIDLRLICARPRQLRQPDRALHHRRRAHRRRHRGVRAR